MTESAVKKCYVLVWTKCPTHRKSRDEESAAQLILLCAPLKLAASLSHKISSPSTERRQRKTEFSVSVVCAAKVWDRERGACVRLLL